MPFDTLRDSSSSAFFDGHRKPLADRYEILEEVGRGGMGIVYKARHRILDKIVAVKVLPRATEKDGFARFEREARIMARLDHPNLLKVEDFGVIEGCPYFSMPFLEGRDLKEQMRARPDQRLPLKQGIEIMLMIGRGLQHCHANGVLHRDIKPSNIVLEDNDPERPVLLDFGLAKLRETTGAQGLTRQGETLGTPEYMSPEQLNAEAVGPAADVWGFGATFYHLVTGRPPRAPASMVSLYQQITREPPRPPSELNPKIPDWLDELLLDCFEPDPLRRVSLDEVLKRLTQGHYRPSRPRRRRARGPGILGAAAGLILGAGAVLALRPSPLIIQEIQAPSFTRSARARVRGRAGSGPLEVVSGAQSWRFPDGRFDLEAPVRGGLVRLTLRRGFAERPLALPVVVDTEPPRIVLEGEHGKTVSLVEGELRGQVVEANLADLTVDGRSIKVDSRGRFRVPAPRRQRRLLIARDAAGNLAQRLVELAPDLGPHGIISDRSRWLAAPKDLQDRAIAEVSELIKDDFRWMATRVFVLGERRHRLGVFEHRVSRLSFHLLPGGEFVQGIEDLEAELDVLGEAFRSRLISYVMASQPCRRVRVPPFLIMRDEIKPSSYQRIVGEARAGKIFTIPWGDIPKVLRELSDLRLPSEAEWEYASRAGATTRFFWGDRPDPGYALCAGALGPKGARRLLRQDRGNAFGLIDTQGSLWEWVIDDYNSRLPEGNDHRPYFGRVPGRGQRVARGGSSQNPFASAAYTVRLSFNPSAEVAATLRLVADIPWRGTRD